MVDRRKEINDPYLWSHEEEETFWKAIENLHCKKETLTTDKAHEIVELKKAQEELKEKNVEEITELKKEIGYLVVEKAQIFTS